jgi:hypothetical protein
MDSASSGQIITGMTILVTTLVFIYVGEMLYVITIDAQKRFQTIIDYTANSEEKTIVIHQDPSKYADAKTIGLSVNERTGIEFAYAFHIFVLPQTFSDAATFKHVFHKGFACPWPLMGPGVFIHGATNTMRVFMNTYKNPFTYADVQNIPVKKWFHVALNCSKGGLDIFVNGNLANRIVFDNTLPYQNFQDLILFSNMHIGSLLGSGIPSLNNEDFRLDGSFRGFLSNMVYARYSLSFNEIQAHMNAGPSSKINEAAMDKPPYFADDWWSRSV